MEELNIKEIWQTQKLSTPDFQEDELERMLRKKSQSIVDKLKKTTRIEHAANIIVSIFLIIFFLYHKEYSFSVFLSIFMFAVVAYYKKLYNKLQSIQPSADVHLYLEQVYEKLNDFINKYQISLSILFTISFMIGLYLGIKDKPPGERFNEPSAYVKVIVVYAVALALCFFIVYLLYGKKAKRIKEMLNQIEE